MLRKDAHSRRTRAGLIARVSNVSEISGSSVLASNDVVPFDDCGDSDVRPIFVVSLVDANNASMGANEYFRSAGNFGGQRKRKVEFRARREVSLHSKIHAAR